MGNDDAKPILIPMPVLPSSETRATGQTTRKKKAVKKKAVKKRVAAGLEAEIRELAATSKIQAIKVYRERTGTGLREAKEAVEAIMK